MYSLKYFFFVNLGVEKFNKNDIFGAIEIILESLKCLSRILSQKNSIITEGEDNLGKCFALAGKILI